MSIIQIDCPDCGETSFVDPILEANREAKCPICHGKKEKNVYIRPAQDDPDPRKKRWTCGSMTLEHIAILIFACLMGLFLGWLLALALKYSGSKAMVTTTTLPAHILFFDDCQRPPLELTAQELKQLCIFERNPPSICMRCLWQKRKDGKQVLWHIEGKADGR